MRVNHWLSAAIALSCLVACVGCEPEAEPDPSPIARPNPPEPQGPTAAQPGEPTPGPEDYQHQLEQLPTVELTVGGVPVTAYLANTTPTRRLGLMFVEELPDDRAMIFVYPRAGRHGFWMHNTYIPLSIAYITEGFTVDEVIDMQPHSDDSVESRALVRYVLEVNEGWFERHRVPREGAKVEGLGELLGYE